mmetsp:Transcript_44314/g.141898  ORF Transcript_44314/g.141898 Transcript_44314/m.141898 type:complete len:295 (+) Transcript_44314:1396-2280(+)
MVVLLAGALVTIRTHPPVLQHMSLFESKLTVEAHAACCMEPTHGILTSVQRKPGELGKRCQQRVVRRRVACAVVHEGDRLRLRTNVSQFLPPLRRQRRMGQAPGQPQELLVAQACLHLPFVHAPAQGDFQQTSREAPHPGLSVDLVVVQGTLLIVAPLQLQSALLRQRWKGRRASTSISSIRRGMCLRMGQFWQLWRTSCRNQHPRHQRRRREKILALRRRNIKPAGWLPVGSPARRQALSPILGRRNVSQALARKSLLLLLLLLLPRRDQGRFRSRCTRRHCSHKRASLHSDR